MSLYMTLDRRWWLASIGLYCHSSIWFTVVNITINYSFNDDGEESNKHKV